MKGEISRCVIFFNKRVKEGYNRAKKLIPNRLSAFQYRLDPFQCLSFTTER
jgi:hypothetical protein